MVLRNAERGSVQHCPRALHSVSDQAECFDQLVEKLAMLPDHETFYVLEDGVGGGKFGGCSKL